MAVRRHERAGPGPAAGGGGVVVEDSHQGPGIGPRLMAFCAGAAADVGIAGFVGEVLPDNGAMLRVFSDFGYHVRGQYADGVIHLSFPISPTEESRQVQESREL